MSHTCPICHELKDDMGVIGGRVGCRHSMCRQCVKEWLNIENRCPMCRKVFHRVDFPLTPTIRIHEDKIQKVPSDYDDTSDSSDFGSDSDSDNGSDSDNESDNDRDNESDNDSDNESDNDSDNIDYDSERSEKERTQAQIALCDRCRTDERPDKLLLCDNIHCYSARHTYCCDPPLRRVPSVAWMCPRCDSGDIGTDPLHGPPSSRTRGVRNRHLPDLEAEWSGYDTTPQSAVSWSPS